MHRRVAVVIDRHTSRYADVTFAALAHAAAATEADIDVHEVPSRALTQRGQPSFGHGVVIGPGSPYDAPEVVLGVIRSARERGVPLVGT